MFTQSFTVSGSSLKLLKVGERGIVTSLNDSSDAIAQQLHSMGIGRGTTITLEQRSPRFMVRVGGNQIALSDPMVRAIYLRVIHLNSSAAKRKTDPRGMGHSAARLESGSSRLSR